MEPIAGLLGDAGDPRAERPEEGAGKDDREVLRRQHADRPGSPRGEHPGDRVRPVAELRGDVEDAARGDRVQPIGVVEGKGHGRLGDARPFGHISDRHASSCLLQRRSSSGRTVPVRPPLPSGWLRLCIIAQQKSV